MKYVKIYENFKLVDLSNSQWYGDKPNNEYVELVKSHCFDIAMNESGTSEKDFTKIDNLQKIVDKVMVERQQELDAIVHNCKHLNMRPQYCAETIYHSIVQGRIKAIMERPSYMGGLG